MYIGVWPLRKRWLAALLLLLLACGGKISSAGSCKFHHVNQATDMFPSGPGTANMTCKGCYLDTTKCRLTCKSGCLLPDGSRGPKTSLSLRFCSPDKDSITITNDGQMICAKPSNR
ncbi:hypothetical protein Vafri_15505 [Volvox africanus]|uniref:Uncharacterized protein n=1 Tax=Volvox africanus TaxID=51714 RepID=A0A8J4BLJ2_9CHLO|nr:hypothetical protein Vafri_15505 [Volvox africanus]